MYKAKLIKLIQEIQLRFPKKLLQLTFLEPVSSKNLDELMERLLTVYSPVFLPVFTKPNGDIISIHLKPNSDWQAGAWILLEHDSAEPRFLASSFKFFPYAMLFMPFNSKKYVDEIWSYILDILKQVNSEIPDQEYIREKINERFEVLARYDQFTGVIKLTFLSGELFDPVEAEEPVENLFQELPEDTYVLAGTAIMRSSIPNNDAVSLAVKVLHREVPHGFYYLFWTENGDSAPELLEVVRPIALPGLNPDSPLFMLKDAPYTKKSTADILRQIAAKFREQGDDEQALNQLRNGALVALRYGPGLDKKWRLELAKQADRIEPGCPAASLAYYAAEIVKSS
ncbi:MAG TPA: hypothetical protein VHY08_10270 [Bacillota bacterium]|nr:hypothetical protein [Bacillota bacterium]